MDGSGWGRPRRELWNECLYFLIVIIVMMNGMSAASIIVLAIFYGRDIK